MSGANIDTEAIYRRVAGFIRSARLLDGIGHIDIALSGGADSVCLAVILGRYCRENASFGQKGGISLRCHHIRHGLRDGDGVDAGMACKVAESLGIEFIQTDLHLRDIGAGQSESVAREARYAALGERVNDEIVQCAQGTSAIALAHNGDENLETAIWRLGRGCGIEGLALSPRRILNGILLIRPLLVLSKSEIYGYLSSLGIGWAEDPTNASDDYTRNRIRHTVLPPILNQSPSPERLYKSLIDIRSDAESLSGLADGFVSRHDVVRGCWFCPWRDFDGIGYGGMRQVLRHAARVVVPGHGISSEFVDMAVAAVVERIQTRRRVCDGVVSIGWTRGGIAVWSESDANNDVAASDTASIAIQLPCTRISLYGLSRISVFGMVYDSSTKFKNTRDCIVMSLPDNCPALSVLPASLLPVLESSDGHAVRMSEALRALGVPDAWRRLWPVVCTADGIPLWVVGGMRTAAAMIPTVGLRSICVLCHESVIW